MKTKTPYLRWLLIGLAVLLIGGCLILYYLSGIDIFAKPGWNSQNGITKYLDNLGKPVTEWQTIDGKSYYFEPETAALTTGWLELDNHLYYLDPTGATCSSWQTIDGNRYYLEENGAASKGWKTFAEDTYYFSGDGAMVTGLQTIEASSYYFSSEGALQYGWQTIDGKRYYFNTDGTMHTGWLEEGTDRYYFHEDGTMAVGEVVIDETSYFFTSQGKYVILVNPWHLMPEDYTCDLVDIEGFLIDSSCKDALQQMIDDCRAAGYKCEINNTYRSVETQQEMWDVRIKMWTGQGMSYKDAVALIGESLALPAASEHNLGLAVDILGTDGMYAWLNSHCHEYGFIMRYPDNKMDITGIIYEPWHFRYVGTELAQELAQLGLCMEEYMQMLTAK